MFFEMFESRPPNSDITGSGTVTNLEIVPLVFPGKQGHLSVPSSILTLPSLGLSRLGDRIQSDGVQHMFPISNLIGVMLRETQVPCCWRTSPI